VAQAIIEGSKIYYEVHGEGRPGPPLVLLMGIGGTCQGWLPLQVPDFCQAHPTVIFDYPGTGQSESREGRFTTADLAHTTVGLLDALEIPRAHVLGSFMGGMVAQELVLRRSDRVERLVLVGTYARPDAKRRTLLTQWSDLARLDAPVEMQVRERLLWTLQDETLEQSDLIDAMVGFFTRERAPMDPDVFARQCGACIAHDCLDRLHEIDKPTLILCGRGDQLTPPKFHRQLADEIANARLVTFASCGHLVMAESAKPFNRAVLQFLEEHPAA
jgi:3-oxoadipate enol-lactonase